MKINLTIEGTPEQLRAFIRGGLVNPLADRRDFAGDRAAQILETAVARGRASIDLAGCAESEAVAQRLALAGDVEAGIEFLKHHA